MKTIPNHLVILQDKLVNELKNGESGVIWLGYIEVDKDNHLWIDPLANTDNSMMSGKSWWKFGIIKKIDNKYILDLSNTTPNYHKFQQNKNISKKYLLIDDIIGLENEL